MLSGKKEEVTNKEESQATSIANEFTQERLQEVWLEYTQQIQAKQPRMSSVLAEYKPTLKDHFIVSYPAINDRQKDLLAERSQDLVKTLREKLMNSQINVEWVVIDTTEAQSTDSKKRLYTSQDKLQFLIQKNPTLEDLRKELDMDFR